VNTKLIKAVGLQCLFIHDIQQSVNRNNELLKS